LAPVLEPDGLPAAVAAAVGYAPPQGVSVIEGLPRFLERKDLLLILDNCEHLVGVVAEFVTATIAHAACVSVLATSREALGVRGEHISPLASLGVPDAADVVAVLASEAGALFVARTCEARGEFALDAMSASAVHGLCLRLDGIPLAIELAAAQTKVMTPAEILARLDQQFRLLTGGQRTRLERHQTLRAAIDWSYDLLTDEERELLGRLSVCVGGFDLDAAAAIAAGGGVDEFDAFELVGSLVAKSLLERNERGGVTRYRVLEMIRQYAAERLNATGGASAARDDHARHYLAVAQALFGDASTTDGYEPLERLETETPNIAAAGRWLLADDRIGELLEFFERLPFLDQLAAPLTALDELGGIAAETTARLGVSTLEGFAAACLFAGGVSVIRGDTAGVVERGERAKDSPRAESLPFTFVLAAGHARAAGDLASAAAFAGIAVELARRRGDPVELCWMLGFFAIMARPAEPDRAVRAAEEAVALARRTGGTVIRLYPLLALISATRLADPRRSLEAAEECIRIDGTARQTYASGARIVAAFVRVADGQIAAGLTEFRDALHHWDRGGEHLGIALSLPVIAGALASFEPGVAVDFAAIAESDAITRTAAFDAEPALTRLTDEHAADVAAAHGRAAAMSYHDALAFIFDTIDQLIAKHAPLTTTS
jgi:predicted ATPase